MFKDDKFLCFKFLSGLHKEHFPLVSKSFIFGEAFVFLLLVIVLCILFIRASFYQKCHIDSKLFALTKSKKSACTFF